MDTAEEIEFREQMRRWEQSERERSVNLAAALGVTIVPLDADFYPGLNFSYESGVEGWPEVHLLQMLFNWRLSVVDGRLSYGRYWCFAGRGTSTFVRAIEALKVWRGDPSSEPRGFIKSWDHRSDVS